MKSGNFCIESNDTQYSDFDAATNQPKTDTHYHGTDASNNAILHSIFYTYNPSGMATSVKDAKDNLTNISYYPNNVDMQSITNGQGTISYTWNTNHDITSITDRMNVITAMSYNSFGQLEAITQAQGTAVQAVTELTYDPTAKTLMNVKKNGNVLTSFTYDPVGRVQTRTDATGIILGYGYDNLDRLTSTTYPDNKTSTIAYSGCCVRMIDSVTERSGLTTTYIYDSLKRLTNADGPKGSFEFQYDKNGNLKKLIDKNRTPQVETLFDYDSDDRLTKKAYADVKYVQYGYDKAGLIKSFINARNITKSYAYDNNDNLISISYSDSTPSVAFTPDDYNRRWKMDDGSGHYEYTYDANNRLRFVDGPWTDDTIEMKYNELGRITNLIPQGGQSIEYVYDTIGRLTNIKPSATNFTYGYTDVNPLIQSLTRPNGSITEYQYNDPLKRLTDVINKTSTGQIINSFNYIYNNLDLKGTETITNGEAIDNFVEGTTTYTPNNLNQTTATTNPNRTYVYDADGNMTSGYTPEGYTLTMTYNAENRMKSAEYTDSSSIVHRTEYGYGGDNFVAEVKKFDGGVMVSDTKYVRAGFLLVQERDGNDTLTREYTWGLNMGGGIGGLLNLSQGSNNYAYLYDGKGNVLSLVDSLQNVVANYRYDPFGVMMKKTATLEQPYMFSTKEYDPQTGLNYYGYRFYSPLVGKWTTRDPLGEAGGINLYGFVANSPINWIDPFGLDLTPAQQAAIQTAAQNWSNSKVPYVYGGHTKKGADCSGAVSGIYNQAGIDIGRLTTQGFKNSPLFSPATGDPQIGDVGVYPGHVDLYGGNTGPDSDVWSASHTGGSVFGPANSSWYGQPTWYRYNGQ